MEFTYRQKQRLKKWGALLSVLALCGIFHTQILGALGDFLMIEDEKQQSEVLFVLGGNSFERGLEAHRLLEEGWSNKVICTGGNVPMVLAAIDTVIYEAEITKDMLMRKGIDKDAVVALTGSTSTKEESGEILAYCKSNALKKITVISSRLHMRRVRMVFEKAFENQGIEIVYRGAPSQNYDENSWWKSEAGLIMVNNEYVKYVYYLIKY